MQEELEVKWNKFYSIVSKLDEAKPGCLSLVDRYADRLVIAPASTETIYFGAYPGGLVDLSLQVTSCMKTLHKSLGLDIDITSVVFTGLFHAIGLMGDENDNLLEPHDSDWHIKRGVMYKHNEKLPKMPTSHRTLYLLQLEGVRLTYDEWTAISMSTGIHRDESKFYAGTEPELGLLLLQAKQWITRRVR